MTLLDDPDERPNEALTESAFIATASGQHERSK